MQKDLSKPHWQIFIDGARIDCPHQLELECPGYWGRLRTTDEADVRTCSSCGQAVQLVVSQHEFAECAVGDACVAVVRPEELPPSWEMENILRRRPKRRR